MTFRSLLGVGLLAVAPATGLAQVALPPPGAQADLNGMSREMAGRLRRLGDTINADLGQSPNGPLMARDVAELAQSMEAFGPAAADPNNARPQYSGIDSGWHTLRSRITPPGVSTPNVEAAAKGVDEIDAQLHQALGMNPYPPGYALAGGPPTGVAETQRLANTLASRAAVLASTLGTELVNDPNAAAINRDAAELARAADAYHDAIDASQPLDVAARAFAPIDPIADRLERYVTSNPVSPRVTQAWQAFAAVEVLIHQNLGLNSPQPDLSGGGLKPLTGQADPPIVGYADQLVSQSRIFVDEFAAAPGQLPEGELLLDDARRLQAAAAAYRQAVGGNLAPNQLAYQFRDVDDASQRLSRRVSRYGWEEDDPNMQRVRRLGVTLEKVHRLLGMPGYPPNFGGPAGVIVQP